MPRHFPNAISAGIVLVFLLLTLAASPRAAQATTLATEPAQPTDNTSFRLLFFGAASGFPVGGTQVELIGNTIRVIQTSAGAGIIDPPPLIAISAEVPPLPPGSYDVEVVEVSSVDPDDPGFVLSTGSVSVAEGLRASIEPPLPSAPLPSPTSREMFRIQVSGFSTCSEISGPVEVQGNRVLIPVEAVSPCPLPPVFLALTTPPIGPLPAGEYEVIVPDRVDVPVGESNIRHRSDLRILPDPVLLGEAGRFEVGLDWGDFSGNAGRGIPVEPSAEPGDASALLWFFEPDNWEMLVKVLDACSINGHYWVFAAASTDVEYTLTVTDTLSGEANLYQNDLGTASPAITDTLAFDCE